MPGPESGLWTISVSVGHLRLALGSQEKNLFFRDIWKKLFQLEGRNLMVARRLRVGVL